MTNPYSIPPLTLGSTTAPTSATPVDSAARAAEGSALHLDSLASTPARTAPRPTLAPLPPSASFLATLQTPSRPWLTDLSEADLKSYIRAALARRDVRMANLYAAELARRNTLCQLEREHGYAALASALVAARKGRVAA